MDERPSESERRPAAILARPGRWSVQRNTKAQGDVQSSTERPSNTGPAGAGLPTGGRDVLIAHAIGNPAGHLPGTKYREMPGQGSERSNAERQRSAGFS